MLKRNFLILPTEYTIVLRFYKNQTKLISTEFIDPTSV